MSKTQADRTFCVRVSSVKRTTSQQGRARRIARAPKKRPGSTPKLGEKARRLLASDLEERPYPSPFRSAATT